MFNYQLPITLKHILPILPYLPAYKVFPTPVRRSYLRAYKAPFYVSFCALCTSLRLKRTVFRQLQIKVRPKGLHSFAFYILIFDFSFLHLLSYLRAYKVFPPHVRRRYLCAYKAPFSPPYSLLLLFTCPCAVHLGAFDFVP